MSYIIIQEDVDPLDIENISVLPDEKELKVKQFKKEEDAAKKEDAGDEMVEIESEQKKKAKKKHKHSHHGKKKHAKTDKKEEKDRGKEKETKPQAA